MALIRAANNGISAVVDGYGRILDRLDLNVRGVIDTALPANLPPPPYARWGDGIFLLLWLAGAAALALQRHLRPSLPRARGHGSTP
jgi:apolipoprotein N-acyltransferase